METLFLLVCFLFFLSFFLSFLFFSFLFFFFFFFFFRSTTVVYYSNDSHSRVASLRQAACLPGGTYPTSPSGGAPLGHGPHKPLNAFI